MLLLVSGLPWTGFWGSKAQELATANDSSLWSTDPGAISNPTSRLDESLPHSHAHEVREHRRPRLGVLLLDQLLIRRAPRLKVWFDAA